MVGENEGDRRVEGGKDGLGACAAAGAGGAGEAVDGFDLAGGVGGEQAGDDVVEDRVEIGGEIGVRIGGGGSRDVEAKRVGVVVDEQDGAAAGHGEEVEAGEGVLDGGGGGVGAEEGSEAVNHDEVERGHLHAQIGEAGGQRNGRLVDDGEPEIGGTPSRVRRRAIAAAPSSSAR